MVPLRRAAETYRTEGPAALGTKGLRFLTHRLSDLYWRMRGTRTVVVDDTSATFPTKTMTEARTVRRLLGYESHVLEDVLAELVPDDVFYDIGAHVGLYTCFAVNALPDENVVAVEPHPNNVTRLRRNLTYNGTPRVLAIALSDADDAVRFDNPVRSTLDWGGRGSIATDPGTDAITVDARTGDDLIDRGTVPPPTVVKIDVEGAEPLVIDGMSDALEHERCRAVYCEVHRTAPGRRSAEDYGSTPEEVETMLSDLGFTVRRLSDRGAELLLKATK